MSVTRPTLNGVPLPLLVLVEAELELELLELAPAPVLALELLLLLLELPQAARTRASTPAHRAISPNRPILPLTRTPPLLVVRRRNLISRQGGRERFFFVGKTLTFSLARTRTRTASPPRSRSS